MIDEKPFSNVLKCFWTSIHAGEPGVIRMELPKYSCTDMSGAIKIAESLDPDVVQIQVRSNGVMDTFYSKTDGVWKAYDARSHGGL